MGERPRGGEIGAARRRRLLRVLVPLLAALLLATPIAGSSPAAAATDGTLGGETFTPPFGSAITLTGTCNTVGPSTITFTATGTATGPVPGTYRVEGTFTLMAQVSATGARTTTVTSLTADFGVAGAVVGSVALTNPPPGRTNFGTCVPGSVPPFVTVDVFGLYDVTAPFVETGLTNLQLSSSLNLRRFFEFFYTACSDGLDNDGDGRFDFGIGGRIGDADCTSFQDTDEGPPPPPPPACRDGRDNDGDGAVDHPADPGCAGPDDTTESPDPAICPGGVDADGDGVCDDTAPPRLTVPSTITVAATGADGATVTYGVSATDDVDPDPDVTCTPPSGTVFPVGTTTVSCRATDDAGNTARATFDVVVIRRDTVVVLLEGIDPLPVVDAPRTKDPEATMAAPGLFGPLLAALGCTAPAPDPQVATTVPCDDGSTHWAAYSFAGVDAAGVPRPYRGFDTHQPLATSASHLQDLVEAVRRQHGNDANVVLVGFSLGGTVAARWASDHDARDVPVVTLASPVYGMWPDARSTRDAEDVDWYCNPLTAGTFAEPYADAATHQALCASWPVDLIRLGPLGFARGGYRSAASYDWRAGRVVDGPTRVRDLLLLNAGNRRDMVAPVFWQVHEDAAGIRLAECTDDMGHGCLKALPSVIGAVARVVDVVRTSGAAASRAAVAAAFTQGAPAAATRPAQLDGYGVDVRPSAGWQLVGVGERVVTYGATPAGDTAAVTCLDGATVTRTGAGVHLRWSDWRPHALVLRFRHVLLPLTFQATARVVPAADAGTYTLDVTPLPGRSDGACPVP